MDSSPIYSLRVSDVYLALESSPDGLPAEEVEARRSLYGDNSLSEAPVPPLWRRFIVHIGHPMALLLWGAGVVAFISGEPALGFTMWLLVLINGLFSQWRERRAEQAVKALQDLLPTFTRLAREGSEVKVPASEVVPGDILVLAEGDHIPADARVVEEYGLRVNNSTLTGEAVPARKTADASLREGMSELERPNLVFAGTSVVSGTARAVVYATGMLTQFGRIAHLTQTVHEEPSPLQKELSKLTQRLTLVALGLGVLVFIIGIFEVHLGWVQAFVLALGILVAAVPEGLPATNTLSLAMAGQRLAGHGVLVKKLSTVETLGTVSVLCTDKSGTLTQNQMTVREVWVAGERFTISGVGYEPSGEFSPRPNNSPARSDLERLLVAASLCNNSRLNPPTPENPQWTCLGDQTEAALRVAAQKGGVDESRLDLQSPRIHELPFDARRKRMSTIHRINRSDEVAFVKGAPREVLQLCTHILIRGEEMPLDATTHEEILKVNDEYARNILRVLALAQRRLTPGEGRYTPERIEQGLVFLGLMGMMDPPRPDVAEAVKTLREAGIRMAMITGDYGLTAESLTRRVGMVTSANPVIITGAELDALDDLELQKVMEQETIFARMAPEHKLRLVSAFQANGEVVAVTGDGVNDAPALRKADVGIAMGIAGTDVSKEAADIILTNDHFASITNAIEEGRAVYDNIRKFMTYIFSSNVPEILPFILTAMFRIPLALTVMQILAIDLGTDLFPALALGTEKPEPDIMKRPPRRRTQPLIDRGLMLRAFLWLGLIEAALCYTGFFLVYAASGNAAQSGLPWLKSFSIPQLLNIPAEQVALLAVTVFHAGVVTSQVGNVFACRTEKARGRHLGWLSNRFLLGGVAIELAIILCLIYIPVLAQIFDHVPLPAYYWIFLSLFAPIVYSLDWIRKGLVRWLGRTFMSTNRTNGGMQR
jgi:P-type Ca2+ transporter type 2C